MTPAIGARFSLSLHPHHDPYEDTQPAVIHDVQEIHAPYVAYYPLGALDTRTVTISFFVASSLTDMTKHYARGTSTLSIRDIGHYLSVRGFASCVLGVV